MGFQSKIVDSKRSLGQNFFVNKNLAEKISVMVIDENPDVIVEIGPGTGAFSQFLVEHNSRSILVEKDNLLANDIQKRFQNTMVLNKDFLEWDFAQLEQYSTQKILFFGSLPYNVSKRIVGKIIKSKYFNTPSYFIIQKEVALKYTSQIPNNNLLSVTTSIYSKTKRIIDISPESFRPKPNVESSLIKFVPNSLNLNIEKQSFEKFLRICFKQPRKTLRNNLRLYTFNSDISLELLNKRAQHLTLNDFLFLFSNIK